MMDADQALRLQAWVDGELSPAEAGKVEAWVARDPEAKTLTDELRAMTSALAATPEVQHTVPETREFYWSQIVRGIEQAERSQARNDPSVAPRVAWWRHWYVPASALAAVLLIVPMTRWLPGARGTTTALSLEHEVDTPIEDVNAFTFRSESERMTVVWVSFDTD